MLRIKSSQTDLPTCVPLRNISIDAEIKLFAADVCITQIYQNNESTPVEAVYCFPIEENVAIYSFTAFIADRVITTVIKERVEAQQEYSEALASGDGAYLMEQDEKSNDIFIVSVGALPQQAECKIEIKYVTELNLVNGKDVRFVLPTTIAPRYNPDAKSISSPAGTGVKYAQQVPYTINFECCIEKLTGIKSYSSPSHPIKIDLGSNSDKVRISFSQDNVHLDRDIIIYLELSKESNTLLAVEQNEANQLTLMAALCPSDKDCQKAFGNKSSEINNEFIFIVDCSGSMEDENKIELARQALLLFLKSLPVGCLFNVIRFGSTYKVLFESDVTVLYNKDNARKAEDLIKGMKADLGGTEILSALTWIFKSPPKHGFSRQIILLTDGEVSNVDEVVEKCRTVTSSTRIFSFGVGHSPSRSLIKSLARSTNGRYVFVPPNSSVDIYVAEQLEKALQPSITNLKVKWIFSGTADSKHVENIPSIVPPVYAGDRIILYGLCNADKNIRTIEVTVELLGSNNVSLGKATNNACVCNCSQMISRLAAKANIQELTYKPKQEFTASKQKRFGTQLVDNNKTLKKQEIIDLSLQHQILSSYTAFVGVEKRVDGNNEGMVLREVPLEICADDKLMFGNYRNYRQGMCFCSLDDCPTVFDTVDLSSSNIAKARKPKKGGGFSLFSGLSKTKKSSQAKKADCNLINQTAIHEQAQKSSSIPNANYQLEVDSENDSEIDKVNAQKVKQWPIAELDVVRHLISLQQFDGLWCLKAEEVNSLSGKSLQFFKDTTVNLKCSVEVLTSLIVLVMLETKFSAHETLWKAVANKAKKHLVQILASEDSFESCFQIVYKICHS